MTYVVTVCNHDWFQAAMAINIETDAIQNTRHAQDVSARALHMWQSLL